MKWIYYHLKKIYLQITDVIILDAHLLCYHISILDFSSPTLEYNIIVCKLITYLHKQ